MTNAFKKYNMKVNIDFDEATREWRRNKIRGPNGTFEYRCEHLVVKTQQYCRKVSLLGSNYCRRHQPSNKG